MKTRIFFLAVITTTTIHAQVLIESQHLPDEGDVLVTQSALLVTAFDPEDTGEEYTWNYGFDVLQPLGVSDETVCVDVDESPLVYQFLFNNPFDPQHNSDFAYGVDQFGISGFNFEDAYFYFKKNGSQYTQTGAGVTINDIPAAAQGDPVDVIYPLPVSYPYENDGDSKLLFEVEGLGAYQVVQHRHNQCTGYGTLNIWGQSYEVLLIKTEIVATDSVFIDFIGQGQSFARPVLVEYKWMSPDLKVPVLQINTSGGIVSSVRTADIYTGIKDVQELLPLAVFPNPVNEKLQVSGIQNGDSYMIIDDTGRIVERGVYDANKAIEISDLVQGSYFFSVQYGVKYYPLRFLKR
ncbi:MAG: T9SS type A sorting domain-containing protein [Crocinitomicaceae bacterium]|nr:T9SS type A sorting domain-containing protein [Crocinitomicaceae bacterium]